MAFGTTQHLAIDGLRKRILKLDGSITGERASTCCQPSQQYAPILRNIHRVRCGLTSRQRSRKRVPDLRRDLRVRVCSHDITQRVLLLRYEVCCIALAEHKQTLVPEHGECTGCVPGAWVLESRMKCKTSASRTLCGSVFLV
jgi:hypothetical protein